MATEIVVVLIIYIGIIVALLALISAHIQRLAHPQEKSFLASSTASFTLTLVVASLLLPALDVAMLSFTNLSGIGIIKDSVSSEKTLFLTKLAYLVVHGLLLVNTIVSTPFSWIFFEEWDEESSNARRIASALKWTIAILVTFAIIFALGLVLPAASRIPPNTPGHIDFEYLKRILASSKPVKSLLFLLGIGACVGTLSACYYLSPGLATLPLSMLKTPSSLSTETDTDTVVELDLNRQQQRQIELRYEGLGQRMLLKERKTLESLQRRERAMLRKQRLSSQKRSWVFKSVVRPLQYLIGASFLVASLLIMAILSITCISELLTTRHIPNLKLLAYLPCALSFILHVLVVLFLALALTHGIRSLSLRFLWLKLYSVTTSKSPPQALLSYSLMAAVSTLGIHGLIIKVLGPEYITYGSQTICTGSSVAECAEFPDLVKQCYGLNQTVIDEAPTTGCHRTVISNIALSMETNYPILRIVLNWAQLAVVGVFLCSLVVVSFKKAKGFSGADDSDVDDDEEHSGTTECSRLLR